MERLRRKKRNDVAAVSRRWVHWTDRKIVWVHAIPQTFTIDSDGVLQDFHIGDAAIEGKLKKLVGQARELQAAQTVGH